ncbi:hypothetical protein LCGC14_1317910 [marine sediment metagenome]|uniref:Uncharacterized protein n=1 Tax=marine sediment metagenome TaxID=412755 RepID=A0A0F9N188_9ZZZZ
MESITSKGSVKKCPECGKKKAKRLIGSGSGIIFKGSGFYQTDYVIPPKSKKSDNKKTIIKKGPADKKELAKKKENKNVT